MCTYPKRLFVVLDIAIIATLASLLLSLLNLLLRLLARLRPLSIARSIVVLLVCLRRLQGLPYTLLNRAILLLITSLVHLATIGQLETTLDGLVLVARAAALNLDLLSGLAHFVVDAPASCTAVGLLLLGHVLVYWLHHDWLMLRLHQHDRLVAHCTSSTR